MQRLIETFALHCKHAHACDWHVPNYGLVGGGLRLSGAEGDVAAEVVAVERDVETVVVAVAADEGQHIVVVGVAVEVE